MQRYLFWALAYEIGLHFRPVENGDQRRDRTLFEIMDYRLTPAQLEHALAEMKRRRTGVFETATCAALSALVEVGWTSPLGWVIRHQTAVRSLLGLR
jgi:hypothetical protein